MGNDGRMFWGTKWPGIEELVGRNGPFAYHFKCSLLVKNKVINESQLGSFTYGRIKINFLKKENKK